MYHFITLLVIVFTFLTDADTQCEEPTGSHPLSIRHVSPEVAQRSLEEYFRNIKLRVSQEENRLAQERRRKYHNVHSECFMEEGPLVEDTASAPQQRGLQQLGRTKKSKRWFKKFGAHSLDSPSQQSQPDSLEDEEKVKSKKRWSFGSTFTKAKISRKSAVRRSSSLRYPSHGKVSRVVEQRKSPVNRIIPDTAEATSDKCYQVI